MLNLIPKNYIYGAIGIMIASIGVYIYLLKADISSLEDKNADLIREKAEIQLEVDKCKNARERMSDKIKDLEADVEFNKALFDKLSDDIANNIKKNETLIDTIRNAPTPETCEEISDFIVKYRGTNL